MNSFAEELSQARKLKGYSQANLAKAISYDRSYVSKLESGERTPSERETVLKIISFLETDLYLSNKLLILANFEPNINTRESYKTCLKLIEEFKNKGLLKKAKDIIRSLKESSSNKFDFTVILAYSYLLEKDYRKAIENYQNAVEDYDNNIRNTCITKAETIHNLGNVYFERGLENKKALEHEFMTQLENNYSNPEFIEKLKAEITGDFSIDHDKFKQALMLQPGHSHIIDQLSRICLNWSSIEVNNAKYLKDSIYYYEKIINSENSCQIEPSKKLQASIYTALCLGRLKEFSQAKTLINTIINNSPGIDEGHYIKGCIYSLNSNNNPDILGFAFESLKKVIEINPVFKERIKWSKDLLNLRFNPNFKNEFRSLYEN